MMNWKNLLRNYFAFLISLIKYIFFLFKKAIYRLYSEDYAFRASALAYTTLLSLVPLLSVIVYLLSLSPPLFIRIIYLARDYLVENFIPSANLTIESYLQNFIDQAARLPTLGFSFLFVTAIILIITIDGVLNEIWQPQKGSKNQFIAFIWRWLVLITIPLIVGISILFSSYLLKLPWIVQLINHLGIQNSLLFVLTLLINTLIFTLVNIVAPRYKVKWSSGFLGGLVTALLFEAAKAVFAFMMKHSTYQAIYGPMAIIPVFLFWLYVYWVIVLFGALFTHCQQHFPYRTNEL